MKKLLSVIAILFTGLNAFAATSFGLRGGFDLSWLTGAKAYEDFTYSLMDQIYTESGKSLPTGFDTKYWPGSFNLGFFFEQDFSEKYGMEIDVRFAFYQGGQATLSAKNYEDSTFRTVFSTLEFSPMFKYNCYREDFCYVNLLVGPNLAFSSQKIKVGIDSDLSEDNAWQKKFLPGVIAGGAFGFKIANCVLLDYSSFLIFDFVKAYNPNVMNATLAEDFGSRIQWIINFGIRFSFGD